MSILGSVGIALLVSAIALLLLEATMGAVTRIKARITLAFALASPAMALLWGLAPAPVYAAAPFGDTVYSRYMQTLNNYTMGCNQGRWQDSYGQFTVSMIMDFGQPDWTSWGGYGSDMWTIGYVTQSQIESAVESYLDGFYNCTVVNSRSFVYLGIGTSNCTPPYCRPNQVNNGHGAFWSGIVSDVWNYIRAHAYDIQEQVQGANDVEPPWSSAGAAQSWINGFGTGPWKVWNYGSADDCPAFGYNQTANPAACANGWTQDDVFAVSYGLAPALPFTEIYNQPGGDTNPLLAVQAYQWQNVAAYAFLRYSGYRMQFYGALSQLQACIDSRDPCTGVNNSPDQSWNQLNGALNSSPNTSVFNGWMKYGSQMSWQTS